MEVPEQTLGGIPLGLGMVMKINFLNFDVCTWQMHALRSVYLVYLGSVRCAGCDGIPRQRFPKLKKVL